MEFIYDRNLLDVQEAKEMREKILSNGYDSLTDDEQEAWLTGMKGSLKHTDLNRIESNCAELSDRFSLDLTTNVDWSMTDKPTLSDFTRIQENVSAIRSTGYAYSTTPQVPSLPINRYDKINDIEQILRDVDYLYTINEAEVFYSGEIYDEEEYILYLNDVQVDYVGEIYADEEIGVI